MYALLLRASVIPLILITFVQLSAQDSLEAKTFIYDNGQISSEGYFKNGQPEGYWKTYYPDGRLKSEGNRRDFLLDSVWKFYSEEGQLKELITYKTGKKNGLSLRYQEDELKSSCDYVDDLREGLCLYYVNGVLEREVPYTKDKEEGKGYGFTRTGDINAFLFYKDGFLRRSERMNERDKLGRKQGLWRTFYEDRNIHTEGAYVDDEKNGLFKEYDRKGELILLEKYRNGLLVTDAEETTVVDIRNEYYPDGRVRGSGSYKNGKKHGVHREYDENGLVVSAIVYDEGREIGTGLIGVNGKIEGPWTSFHENGTVKEKGEYTEGSRSGKWEFYNKEGTLIQKGNYKKGKPDGLWKWYYENGSLRREESYLRGREDGESEEFDEEGELLSKGKFIDGLKEGRWEYHIGDHNVIGNYTQGEKDGLWTGIYENGKKQFKGAFVRGFEKGKHRYYYDSGQLKQDGRYSSGRKDGEWKLLDEEGEIIIRISYEQGIERRLEGVKIIPTFEELGID